MAEVQIRSSAFSSDELTANPQSALGSGIPEESSLQPALVDSPRYRTSTYCTLNHPPFGTPVKASKQKVVNFLDFRWFPRFISFAPLTSAESYAAYVESMPWLIVPWQQAAVRAELAQLYGIRGIPTLLLLDRNGHIITMDARTELAEDPMAQNFPWKPRPVNILTERYANKLHDYPAIVLFVGYAYGFVGGFQFREEFLLLQLKCVVVGG
ncbi:hypothetical protein MTP99_005777 [Tenebrio molitor]|nr:hypothetical protein MTP99_005777 [Tenebrio molitor]